MAGPSPLSEELPDAWLHDGEWARCGRYRVYPRDDGSYSIGALSGVREYRDVETGFQNMTAAIMHANWMAAEDRAAFKAPHNA